MRKICTIHTLILTQTFSNEELLFLLVHANEFKICADCRYLMGKKLGENQKRIENTINYMLDKKRKV